jgi:hypothetical protein
MDGSHPFGTGCGAYGFGETFFVTISFSELADILDYSLREGDRWERYLR